MRTESDYSIGMVSIITMENLTSRQVTEMISKIKINNNN